MPRTFRVAPGGVLIRSMGRINYDYSRSESSIWQHKVENRCGHQLVLQ
jgi:hypothetical protein